MTDLGLEEVDPIGDVVSVAAELTRLGLRPDQSVFVGYFVSFPDESAAALAAHQARGECWRTAVYRADSAHVVRLSRHGPATLRRLRRDWDYMRGFAWRAEGRWEAVAIEELAPDTYWEALAFRLIRRKSVQLLPDPGGPVDRQRSATG